MIQRPRTKTLALAAHKGAQAEFGDKYGVPGSSVCWHVMDHEIGHVLSNVVLPHGHYIEHVPASGLLTRWGPLHVMYNPATRGKIEWRKRLWRQPDRNDTRWVDCMRSSPYIFGLGVLDMTR